MPAALLLDVSCLCDEHVNGALEFMAKAVGENPPGPDIWEPHPNPYIRRLVELFTQRGLDRIAGVRDELARWLVGDMHREGLERPARPGGAMARWSQAELDLTLTYLRALPPAAFLLDDWLLLVDYLVQRYLPTADLRTEADWLATRASIMGRVQAAMREMASEAAADSILAALPSADQVVERFGVTAEQRSAMEFGRARCAEHVTSMADSVRHRLRNAVVDYQEAVILKDPAERQALQTRLFDTFGDMDRDWRRIAVTEATENLDQGFVAAQASGTKLRRVEKYRGACAFCRTIDGRVMTVVAPSKPDKDGDKEVWVGKTNVGRSASPRKRVGGELWDREPQEMWWVAAGAQHPHCRGAWVRAAEGASADPEFEAWLETLKRRRGNAE